MKKFFAIFAIIAVMMLSFSCRNEKVTDEVSTENVDSTELCELPAPDSLVVE